MHLRLLEGTQAASAAVVGKPTGSGKGWCDCSPVLVPAHPRNEQPAVLRHLFRAAATAAHKREEKKRHQTTIYDEVH